MKPTSITARYPEDVIPGQWYNTAKGVFFLEDIVNNDGFDLLYKGYYKDYNKKALRINDFLPHNELLSDKDIVSDDSNSYLDLSYILGRESSCDMPKIISSFEDIKSNDWYYTYRGVFYVDLLYEGMYKGRFKEGTEAYLNKCNFILEPEGESMSLRPKRDDKFEGVSSTSNNPKRITALNEITCNEWYKTDRGVFYLKLIDHGIYTGYFKDLSRAALNIDNFILEPVDQPLSEPGKQLSLFDGMDLEQDSYTNELGGKQTKLNVRMDLLPPLAMIEISRILNSGADKYGEDNWRLIPPKEQLNHSRLHAFKAQLLMKELGETVNDELIKEIAQMACRALFMLELVIERR